MTDQNKQPAGKGAGKTMMVIAWLVGMLLAVKFFASWEESKNNPNQVVESIHANNYIEVTLKSGLHGHYVATGLINGKKVNFLVDTGASYVSIPEYIANDLGLKKGQLIDINTANGISKSWRTRLQSVQLGDIKLENIPATINPNSDEILLGMSFLRELEFTQRNNQLVLRQYKSNK